MMKKALCILCVLSTLFLISCKAEKETVDEKSSTASQTQITVEDTSDETETVVETTTKVEKYKGGQNKFGLTNIRRNALSQKQYEAYKIIANGIDEGMTEIKVDLTTEANSYNKVKSALWSGYPLYALVQEMYYSHSTQTLSVRYSKNETELKSTIKAFYDKIDSIITKELMALDNTSKAIKLYQYVAEKTASDNSNATVYGFILDGKGTDIQFSMAYEYLLGLAGVECNHVMSEVGEKQIALTQVKIGNNYYYMSPYHEAVKNGGKLLEFFGMDNERAKIATNAEEFFSFNNDYEKVTLPDCRDEAFSFTKYIESWSLDTDKKVITYEMTDNIYTYKY